MCLSLFTPTHTPANVKTVENSTLKFLSARYRVKIIITLLYAVIIELTAFADVTSIYSDVINNYPRNIM